MGLKFAVFVCLAIGILTPLVLAQDGAESSNELGLTIGAEFVPDHNTAVMPSAALDFSPSLMFGLNYAHRFYKGDHVAVWLEFPAVAAGDHRVESTDPNTVNNLATFFVTPSIRLQFAPDATVSPFVSGGIGYALFEGSETFRNGVNNNDRFVNTGAFQFGGGVDVKTPLRVIWPIHFRGEVRDFYALNTLNFGRPIEKGSQHNVTVMGGFVLKF